MATETVKATKANWIPAGRGMEYTVLNNELLIKVPLGKEALANAQPSASGKTKVIGTTQGNVKVDGTSVIMGVNVYTKAM